MGYEKEAMLIPMAPCGPKKKLIDANRGNYTKNIKLSTGYEKIYENRAKSNIRHRKT
jgi:hypothetical protein